MAAAAAAAVAERWRRNCDCDVLIFANTKRLAGRFEGATRGGVWGRGSRPKPLGKEEGRHKDKEKEGSADGFGGARPLFPRQRGARGRGRREGCCCVCAKASLSDETKGGDDCARGWTNAPAAAAVERAWGRGKMGVRGREQGTGFLEGWGWPEKGAAWKGCAAQKGERGAEERASSSLEAYLAGIGQGLGVGWGGNAVRSVIVCCTLPTCGARRQGWKGGSFLVGLVCVRVWC